MTHIFNFLFVSTFLVVITIFKYSNLQNTYYPLVILTNVRIYLYSSFFSRWIPAYAGMTHIFNFLFVSTFLVVITIFKYSNLQNTNYPLVILTNVRIYLYSSFFSRWIPAYAGMTHIFNFLFVSTFLVVITIFKYSNLQNTNYPLVILTNVRIYLYSSFFSRWIPAYAGMTHIFNFLFVSTFLFVITIFKYSNLQKFITILSF